MTFNIEEEEVSLNFNVNIIEYLINDIKNDYDISSEILIAIISDPFVKDMIDFLSEITKKMEIETDKIDYCDHCSAIITIYENGYIQYCNVHKYIHDDIDSHEFTEFSEESLNKYIYQKSVTTSYIKRQTILYNKIYHIVKKILVEYSTLETLKISFSNTIDWLSQSKNRYRDKRLYKNEKTGEMYYKFYTWTSIGDIFQDI